MIRIPHAWEDREPERVSPDLPPIDSSPPSLPGAAAMAARVAGDEDPHRMRRGARGAALEMHRESEARGWGLSRAQCRERTNTARRNAAAKRRK